MIEKAAQARKVIIYIIGLLGQLVTLGVVPAAALPYVAGIVAVATGLGIYVVPNDEPGAHAA